jgi:single-strand DNA-binding protein
MAGETQITIAGNITADPELKVTTSGHAVAHFTVASTPSFFDKATNAFKDGEALFLRVNAWRMLGENAAASLVKGARVIVSGRLKQRSYESPEGEKRTVYEIEADDIGPSLRMATAAITRNVTRNAPQDSWAGAPAGDVPPF